MSDLISRQAAIDAVYKCTDIFINNLPVMVDKADAYKALAELPSAQPEIIRCKYCKWWSDDEYRECSSPNYDNVHVTPAGFYCGWAERRTDGV